MTTFCDLRLADSRLGHLFRSTRLALRAPVVELDEKLAHWLQATQDLPDAEHKDKIVDFIIHEAKALDSKRKAIEDKQAATEDSTQD